MSKDNGSNVHRASDPLPQLRLARHVVGILQKLVILGKNEGKGPLSTSNYLHTFLYSNPPVPLIFHLHSAVMDWKGPALPFPNQKWAPD